MRLSQEARTRLAAQDHGILCTVHAERGVDAVPVVFVVGEDGFVSVPIDRVKPKASTHPRRHALTFAEVLATVVADGR